MSCLIQWNVAFDEVLAEKLNLEVILFVVLVAMKTVCVMILLQK